MNGLSFGFLSLFFLLSFYLRSRGPVQMGVPTVIGGLVFDPYGGRSTSIEIDDDDDDFDLP